MSPPFETGVNWYTTGVASVCIHFPEGETKCQYCPYLRSDKELKRFRCIFTQEYILDPFSLERGHLCPIQFEETEF